MMGRLNKTINIHYVALIDILLIKFSTLNAVGSDNIFSKLVVNVHDADKVVDMISTFYIILL